MASAEIPNRAVFRAAEVCEIAELQPYVLRSWEAEFPDLGVAKSAGSPRVYRKLDVEKVLRLKHLILVDGLTLAGARRQLTDEGAVAAPVEQVQDADVAAMMDEAARTGLQDVKRGLEWILGVLGGGARATGTEFALSAPSVSGGPSKSAATKPRGDMTRSTAAKGKKAEPAHKAKGRQKK